MIALATDKSKPFDAIVIHSLSRFFRDVVQFGVYERKLAKHQIKVISITQQTSDDPMGEMARRMFSLFDEYQSKENAKHTARAMRENARQGYFSGARAPFGYKAVITDVSGSRGRKKKRLAIEETEAAVVRRIYDLYLNGYRGKSMGMKAIVDHLAKCNVLSRGSAWTIQKIHRILSSSTYIGEYQFGRYDARKRRARPQSEWVTTQVPAIIDPETFEKVRRRREERSPTHSPPRRVNNPTLLTGLLKCGDCGAYMTLVTGKSGRYRYYKCTTRQSKGNHACPSKNYPMQQLDELILGHVIERVLDPERLRQLFAEVRKRVSTAKKNSGESVKALEQQLKGVEMRLARLYEAIEAGAIDIGDESLKKRVQQLKAAKESTLLELASARAKRHMPAPRILPSNIEAFSAALKKRLQNQDTEFAKRYLGILVDEIIVSGNEASIRGGYGPLAAAAEKSKEGALDQVPSFVGEWRAWKDSNLRPPGS